MSHLPVSASGLDENMLLVIRLKTRDAEFLEDINLLFQEVFQYDVPPSAGIDYLQRLLFSEDRCLVYGLTYHHKLVGALTAHILPSYYAEQSEIFIYDIAIKPQFQRLGLGGRLLKTVRNYARKNGYKGVFVAADEEDQHALDFYTKHGGKSSRVQHFDL